MVPVSSGMTASSGLSALNDEFNDAASLPDWTDLLPALHATDQQGALDINSTLSGAMVLVPILLNEVGWYADNQGPLLFKSVTGNFVVEIAVNVVNRAAPTQAPTGAYNAGGLVIRDPTSTSPGQQRWVMYNMGLQNGTFAREAKTTRANPNGASLSTLFLMETTPGIHNGRLRVCRMGDTFRFFHWMPDETGWTEEAYNTASPNPTQPMGSGAGEPSPGVVPPSGGNPGVIQFVRPDLPQTLQVGLMVGNWGATSGVRGEFDYARFAEAEQASDCVRAF